MNTNNGSLPTAKLPRRPILLRCLLAFPLSFVGLIVYYCFGEGMGYVAGVIAVGVYTLIAQLFLSLGRPQALRQDWPIILCLNFTLLLVAIPHGATADLKILIVVANNLACSYAGAALAAHIARIRTPAV